MRHMLGASSLVLLAILPSILVGQSTAPSSKTEEPTKPLTEGAGDGSKAQEWPAVIWVRPVGAGSGRAAEREAGQVRSGKRDREREAGQVRYWKYRQAGESPNLAISDLSRFPLQKTASGRADVRP